jgi:hypothetical protein
VDHLGAVAAMPPARTSADHEAGDVLQEQQRDLALAAELDEVGALLALSLKRMPLLATMPTGMARIGRSRRPASCRRAP